MVTINAFAALTLGMVGYFAGAAVTRRVAFLREFNIPEPVSGGLLASLITLGIYLSFDTAVSFDLSARDFLLVYFFAAIGLDARIADLLRGGKPLLILLGLTLGYMVVQNFIALIGATLLGLPEGTTVLVGTAALIGGHGTAIAWAPEISASNGLPNALEIGIATATLGLVVASLIGGPIARFLINRGKLVAAPKAESLVGMSYQDEETDRPTINHVSFMQALLALNIAVFLGVGVQSMLESTGIKLPLFVPCMLMAIILTNTVPRLLPAMSWPARTAPLALIADFSLSIFLTMSLMSLQLWTLAGLAGPILIILFAQTLIVALFVILVLFRAMGRDYEAAVLAAGFGGFALGATPTAIANMTAVTKKHGPAPTAFLILPLVAAFFVDIANAVLIPLFLR
jgi:ESS family glutamate:Na+ symporter